MQIEPEPTSTLETSANREPSTISHDIPAPEPAANHPSSIALATEDQPLAAPAPGEAGSSLNLLINPHPTLNLQPLATNPPTVIDARPLPATTQPHKARRKGRIASLPKLQRDMVNRMLWNGVPYKNIVAALDEAGFDVTERNISNWATGGYLEWRFEQDAVLQNRLDQDHLVDHLRRDDASELPEVGLQAAATRLSQILVQKAACADNVEANLGTFSQMVDVLCRLNREIGLLQKQRDDSRRSLGPAYDAARIQDTDQMSAIENERYYSNPPPDSSLEKPAVPPLLPPVPTSEILANADREADHARKLERLDQLADTLRAFSAKKPPASPAPKALPPMEPAQESPASQ